MKEKINKTLKDIAEELPDLNYDDVRKTKLQAVSLASFKKMEEVESQLMLIKLQLAQLTMMLKLSMEAK